MQKYNNKFRKRYNILKMFTRQANNWVFRNIIPWIDNHKIRTKKAVLEVFELLLTQRWHEYHFIGLHNQKTKSEQGIKRESGSVLTPLWVEDRAAFLVGREPVTRADWPRWPVRRAGPARWCREHPAIRKPNSICMTYCIASPSKAATIIHRERSYRLLSHLTCRWESATKHEYKTCKQKKK